MRSISDTLKAAMQSMEIESLFKLQLTQPSETSYTYEEDRILGIGEEEQQYNHITSVLLDNADGALTDIDLKGYQAVLSWGANTTSGKEYSAMAPMWVVGQQFNSSEGSLSCILELWGVPNLLAEDKASVSYIPSKNDTKTVKALLTAILGATTPYTARLSNTAYAVDDYVRPTTANGFAYRCTKAGTSGTTAPTWPTTIGSIVTDGTVTWTCDKPDNPYSHCKAYSIVWPGTPDPLMDVYKPKDGFRIYPNTSRLAVIRRLLDFTNSVMRYHTYYDKLYIFPPTTIGADYDYEYSLDTGHTFFSKAYRNRVVIPNYIEVKSQEEDVPQYSGFAKDQPSVDALGEIREYHFLALESDTQASDIAAAILVKYRLWADAGAATVPINYGAEIFDYIRVTDSREGKERTGNIGSLTRSYKAFGEEYSMRFSFGDWLFERNRHILNDLETYGEVYFSRLQAKHAYIENLLVTNIDAAWIDPEGNVDLSKIGDNLDNLPDGEVYARVKSLHLDAGKIKLDEYILYKAGYDPNTKRRTFTTNPTTPYDVGDLWLDGDVVKRCIDSKATGIYSKYDWEEVTLDEIDDGSIYQRVKSSALTAAGLVILDQVVTGNYGLVLSTDISAGHIKLETILDGAGYKKYTDTEYNKLLGIATGADVTDGHSLSVLTDRSLGFIVDTTTRKAVSADEKTGAGSAYDIFISKLTAYGLSIWTANSSTRVELTASGLKGYNAGTLQVEVATDGRMKAGAGAVVLDANGITIQGKVVRFKDTGGVLSAYMGYYSGAIFELSVPTDDYIWLTAPGSNSYIVLEAAYVSTKGTIYMDTSKGIIFNTVAVAEEGSMKVEGGGGNDIIVYSDGAWRINGT